MSDRPPVKPEQHGTDTGYTTYGCRCAPCTAAHTAYRRSRWATLDEVRQWANRLGFELTGKSRKPLVDRYNREHPNRPYLSQSKPMWEPTAPDLYHASVVRGGLHRRGRAAPEDPAPGAETTGRTP